MMASDRSVITNAFTVDVEDYFHVQAFAGRINRNNWSNYESRVVRATERLLELLADHSTIGTFFVLGWVADHHPGLVSRIHEAGHEVGCHSYWHRQVYTLTRKEFKEDLARSTRVLEDRIGTKVVSYRAPSFSINRETPWVWDELFDAGYRYDSSIFPIRHDRYGDPTAPRFAHDIAAAAGLIREFPPTTLRRFGVNLPIAGGGYFRLFPRLCSYGMKRINSTESQPFVFYVHPWEIDPDQPRLPCSWTTRFRHYTGLRRTERYLDRLLGSCRFGRLCDLTAA